MEKTVDDVRQFWNANPLFTGETDATDEQFFKKHDDAYYKDVFAGIDIEKKFYLPKTEDHTLDLGCGIGFWTSLFVRRGVKSITAADLSEESLKLAKRRVAGANVTFDIQNAEQLTYPDGTFDHCNCQGVIHHTPDTQACMNEIYRVLKPGGTMSVSVYYDNIAVRNYHALKSIIKPAFKLLGKNLGRGREFSMPDNKDDLVRLYDGSDNPIGKSYSKAQFIEMCKKAGFSDIHIAYYFFPGRFFVIPLPKFIRSWLVCMLPFMIIANCKK